MIQLTSFSELLFKYSFTLFSCDSVEIYFLEILLQFMYSRVRNRRGVGIGRGVGKHPKFNKLEKQPFSFEFPQTFEFISCTQQIFFKINKRGVGIKMSRVERNWKNIM